MRFPLLQGMILVYLSGHRIKYSMLIFLQVIEDLQFFERAASSRQRNMVGLKTPMTY